MENIYILHVYFGMGKVFRLLRVIFFLLYIGISEVALLYCRRIFRSPITIYYFYEWESLNIVREFNTSSFCINEICYRGICTFYIEMNMSVLNRLLCYIFGLLTKYTHFSFGIGRRKKKILRIRILLSFCIRSFEFHVKLWQNFKRTTIE